MRTSTRLLLSALVLLGATRAEAVVPTPDHVLIAVMENTAFTSIVGSVDAPYINSLFADGALLTDAHGVTHPSQPNYLYLFSGSNQGVTGDVCPSGPFATDNLGSLLIGAAKTFTGYAEDLPAPGDTSCQDAFYYRRKHNPWVDFTNVPPTSNQPFSVFPADYSTLPTVSIVVPNQYDDMHDGPISVGDAWLQTHLDGYIQWAKTHNSVFILTWDEDDFTVENHIVTLVVGDGVIPGTFGTRTDHIDVLRTIEDMYGLGHAGASDTARQISEVFATCGDGIVEAGEECGDGGLTCGVGLACVSCQCINTPVCSSGIGFSKPSVSASASPFALSMKATAVVPKPWTGVNPPVAGVRLVVDTTASSGGFDITLPGGAAWTTNGSGTKWTYKDATGSVGGITSATVSDLSKKVPGQLSISVKGKGGTVTLPPVADARVSVVFGAPAECATVSMAAHTIACTGTTAKMKCK